jgi:hypothetical protein
MARAIRPGDPKTGRKMSGGLSRCAAVLAPVAIVARTAIARRSTVIAATKAVAGGAGRKMPAAAASSAMARPAEPTHFVIPFAPGGSAGLVACRIAQGSGGRLAPPIVVESRPTAGAAQGSALAAAEAPAGWRILARGIHGVRPLRTCAQGAAGAGLRRGRRSSGAAGQNTIITARAPADRGRDATKPRRNPA